jgi:acylphosphatase
MITRGLRIRGRVQGVGYRDALCDEARASGVSGWVRNRLDGSVEALVQGPPERVAQLIAWARQGPPAARVDRVDIEAREDEPSCAGFQRRPSA